MRSGSQSAFTPYIATAGPDSPPMTFMVADTNPATIAPPRPRSWRTRTPDARARDTQQRHASRCDRERVRVRPVHEADDHRCDHDGGDEQPERGAHVDVRAMRHEADAADADRAHVDEPHTDRRTEHEHHHGRADEREAQPCDRLGERARGDRERRDDERIGGEVEGHVDRQRVREGSVSERDTSGTSRWRGRALPAHRPWVPTRAPYAPA